MKNRKGKDLFMKKKIQAELQGLAGICQNQMSNAFASSICILYVFVDHSELIILLCSLLPLTTLQKSDLLKRVRGHAIADCADDEQPDRVAL